MFESYICATQWGRPSQTINFLDQIIQVWNINKYNEISG